MEDNLKILKVEYLSNHLLNNTKILNLSLEDQTTFYKLLKCRRPLKYKIVFQTLLHSRFRYCVWKAPYFLVWNGRAPRKPRKMRGRKNQGIWFLHWNLSHENIFRLQVLYCFNSFFIILNLDWSFNFSYPEISKS